jgi:hypothetical protein
MHIRNHSRKHSKKHSRKYSKKGMHGGALTEADKANIRIAFYSVLSAIALGTSATAAISTFPGLSKELKDTIVIFAKLMYQTFYNIPVAGAGDILRLSRSFLELSIKYVSAIYAACPQGVTFAAGIAISGPLKTAVSNIGATASSMMNFDPTKTNLQLIQDLFGEALEGLTQLLFILCENIQSTPSMLSNAISSLMNVSCKIFPQKQEVDNLSQSINVLANNPDDTNAYERIANYFERYEQNLKLFQEHVETPEFQELLANVKSMSYREDEMYSQPESMDFMSNEISRGYDSDTPKRKMFKKSLGYQGDKRRTQKMLENTSTRQEAINKLRGLNGGKRRTHKRRKHNKTKKTIKSRKSRKH